MECMQNLTKQNLITEIYSDSQAVIKSLEKRTTKSGIIKICHITLNEPRTGFEWEYNILYSNLMPGHEGNERVDWRLSSQIRIHKNRNIIYNKTPLKIK